MDRAERILKAYRLNSDKDNKEIDFLNSHIDKLEIHIIKLEEELEKAHELNNTVK